MTDKGQHFLEEVMETVEKRWEKQLNSGISTLILHPYLIFLIKNYKVPRIVYSLS